MGQPTITVRFSTDVHERYTAAARARGVTVTRFVHDLLDRFDLATIDTMPPVVDELAEHRAQQMAALAAANLLDDGTRVLLQPHQLPRPLEAAYAAARKGGPGWKFFGRVVAQHVRALLVDCDDEIDAIQGMTSAPVAAARLGELLNERMPCVLERVDRRHVQAVLDAAVAELDSIAQRAAEAS